MSTNRDKTKHSGSCGRKDAKSSVVGTRNMRSAPGENQPQSKRFDRSVREAAIMTRLLPHPRRCGAGVAGEMKTERRKLMLTLHQILHRKYKSALLVGAVLGVLLSSPFAVAAERKEPVLFLSVEDLQLVLSRSSSLSFPTYQRLASSFDWQEQSKAATQESPVAQDFPWDTDLGVDSYTHLGTRPLWGY